MVSCKKKQLVPKQTLELKKFLLRKSLRKFSYWNREMLRMFQYCLIKRCVLPQWNLEIEGLGLCDGKLRQASSEKS